MMAVSMEVKREASPSPRSSRAFFSPSACSSSTFICASARRMADCLAPSASSTAACLRPPARVDGGLLLALRLQNGGALVLLGFLLLGHRLHDVHRRRDVEDLDAVQAHPPFGGGVGHVVLHPAVDRLALGERLVERQLAEDRPQSRAGELVDRELVVVDLEERGLHVDHLAEDGGADLERHVVLRDHGLLVPRHRELAHVDLLHLVDEGHQDPHAGLVDRLELAQPLDDADAPLLDDLDEAREEEGAEPDSRQYCDDDDTEHFSGRCEHAGPLSSCRRRRRRADPARRQRRRRRSR